MVVGADNSSSMLFLHTLSEYAEPVIDIERSRDAFKLKPQLYQRNGDGGLYAYDHGLCVHDRCHRSDVAEHTARE